MTASTDTAFLVIRMRTIALLSALLWGSWNVTNAVGYTKQHQSGQVLVRLFSVSPSYGVFSSELSSALITALRQNNIDASATTGESIIKGRMEVISRGEVQIHASFRGTSVQSRGDLEHLDDLVNELVAKIHPLLSHDEPVLPPQRTTSRKDSSKHSVPFPEGPDARPVETAPQTADARTTISGAEATSPVDSSDEGARIAVTIVGEPISQGGPGFYGIGVAAQQSIINYLQQRMHVVAMPTRLIGLVSGQEALSYSLKLKARYTFMTRFDSLTITNSEPARYGLLALTGRAHIVLLRDGKQQLDRNLAIPVTFFTRAEPLNHVTSRAITAIMETIASDLSSRVVDAH